MVCNYRIICIIQIDCTGSERDVLTQTRETRERERQKGKIHINNDRVGRREKLAGQREATRGAHSNIMGVESAVTHVRPIEMLYRQ